MLLVAFYASIAATSGLDFEIALNLSLPFLVKKDIFYSRRRNGNYNGSCC